jgi:hypothetical protein
MARKIRRCQEKLGGGKVLRRKVLSHERFGACVLLPKSQWKLFPDVGVISVKVNGRRTRVNARIEQCNCRGTGWHEHRFIALPRSCGARGEHVTITLG